MIFTGRTADIGTESELTIRAHTNFLNIDNTPVAFSHFFPSLHMKKYADLPSLDALLGPPIASNFWFRLITTPAPSTTTIGSAEDSAFLLLLLRHANSQSNIGILSLETKFVPTAIRNRKSLSGPLVVCTYTISSGGRKKTTYISISISTPRANCVYFFIRSYMKYFHFLRLSWVGFWQDYQVTEMFTHLMIFFFFIIIF